MPKQFQFVPGRFMPRRHVLRAMLRAWRALRRATVVLIVLDAGRLFGVPPTAPVENAAAQESHAAPADGETAAVAPRKLYIREFRVTGVQALPRIEVEAAVYPYLGPGRTEEDIEQARAALEKAYQDRGFQAASVQVPPQHGRGGVIVLQVAEGRIGRLRVKNSRYFLPSRIRQQARSLAEGNVLNFHAVNRDILALNQWPDRRVVPTLRAGEEPGTVDVDLNVEDTFPLHGSLELNNRYSLDTTELRLNGSLSYNNLWQAGHSLGASFQISPQKTDEVRVFSGYYIARFTSLDWLSLMVQGTMQESNVTTLGASAVAGRGETLGVRAIATLPSTRNLFHSLHAGIDYKHYNNTVEFGTDAAGASATPITYYPLTVGYTASLVGRRCLTEFNGSLHFALRGFGSRTARFDENRFGADGNYLYARGDISHRHDLPAGFQVFARVQGQIASGPLVSNEQIGGGGLGTVRGYLEAEVIGDNAAFGSLEVRSPQLFGWVPGKGHALQLHLFGEGGVVTLRNPLPEQQDVFKLASLGAGARLQLMQHLNGSVDLAFPLISQVVTRTHDPLLTFRVWADF